MSTRQPHPRRNRRILLLVLLAAMVNLPLVHSTWTQWQVERRGTLVTATVVDHRVAPSGDVSRHWLTFRFPEDVDPDQDVWPAEVEEAVYDAAVASGEVEVRVLEGRPSAYQAEGQVRHWLALFLTLGTDLFLAAVVGLIWFLGRRSRPLPLRVEAVGDVESCPPGALLEQIEGSLYLVRGEVAELDDGEIVLDLGDQDVVVVLDGHANPVGYQQSAQVRGRLLE